MFSAYAPPPTLFRNKTIPTLTLQQGETTTDWFLLVRKKQTNKKQLQNSRGIFCVYKPLSPPPPHKKEEEKTNKQANKKYRRPYMPKTFHAEFSPECFLHQVRSVRQAIGSSGGHETRLGRRVVTRNEWVVGWSRETTWSSVGHDEWVSRNPFLVLCVEGHRENFRHVQGRPLFDVVHPAFPLPTTALSTLQGALNDGFGKVVVSREWVGVFSTWKESLHDALSHFRMGHIRKNTSGLFLHGVFAYIWYSRNPPSLLPLAVGPVLPPAPT